MSILSYFRGKKDTASIAKERLQIIVAHQRARQTQEPDFIPMLQREILQVLAKYVKVKEDQVNVQLDKEGDRSILELNITLPDTLSEEN
jgi:cell division topological specificity factor